MKTPREIWEETLLVYNAGEIGFPEYENEKRSRTNNNGLDENTEGTSDRCNSNRS